MAATHPQHPMNQNNVYILPQMSGTTSSTTNLSFYFTQPFCEIELKIYFYINLTNFN